MYLEHEYGNDYTKPTKSKWPKPKRKMQSWMNFILQDTAIPAIVEAQNSSGGLFPGMRTEAWDFDGEFFAIHNNLGNPVWCHKNNLKLLSRGTVEALANTSVRLVKDYRSLLTQ